MNAYPLLDTEVSPVSFDGWLELIEAALKNKERCQLFTAHNLHSLYLYKSEPLMREFYGRSAHCYIDGVPVLWMLSAAGYHNVAQQRFSLMDTFELLLQESERRGWSIFYLGGTQDVSVRSAEKIRAQFPQLVINMHHGYFDFQSEENTALIDTINTLRPDILLVGMGMPRQESWLLENHQKLDVGIATQAGATLDYYAGEQARPPLWMSNAGLGGLYRLLHNPRRLWRRYMVEPWVLLWPTLLMWWRR